MRCNFYEYERKLQLSRHLAGFMARCNSYDFENKIKFYIFVELK